jgi:hypothetical protein
MRWCIGLGAWVIQDGNYGDFVRGERTRFALEADVERLDPAPAAERGAARVDGNRYRVTASIMSIDEVAVLDFGLRAYCMGWELPSAEWVTGELTVSVDPFTYFEGLASEPGVPPLIYTWHLADIRRNVTPWVESEHQYFERDPHEARWESVPETNAWTDWRGGTGAWSLSMPDYLLECELVDDAPQRRL